MKRGSISVFLRGLRGYAMHMAHWSGFARRLMALSFIRSFVMRIIVLSDKNTRFSLMVIILGQPQLVDEVITGFLDLGVTGATVIDSRGMGQIIRQDMPIFAGLASLFPVTTGSRVVLSVMPTELVDSVFKMVEEIAGQVSESNSSVCFTVPVDEFRGIRH